MRIEGTLAKWNDELGFGFISPNKGGTAEVFVHISAFPRDGQRPAVGELLTFEIETDKDGKKKAKNLHFPNRVVRLTPRPRAHREKPSFLWRIVPAALIIGLAFYGYGEYSRRFTIQTNVATPDESVSADSNEPVSSPIFRCDGRTYCSQMTSCAEATFFLKNCPDVKIDGDNDGIPCEEQWCPH